MNGKKVVTYVSLLFSQRRVFFAKETEMESLYTGEYVMRAIGPRLRSEICQTLPTFDILSYTGYGAHAYPTLTVRETEALAEEMRLEHESDGQQLRFGT